MRYTRLLVAALALALVGVAVLFALVPRPAVAQSGIAAAPPVGVPCKVMLRTGMMDGIAKSVAFGDAVLNGTVKASSDDWLVLTLTSDPSKPDLWIPRDNISVVVYGNAKHLSGTRSGSGSMFTPER